MRGLTRGFLSFAVLGCVMAANGQSAFPLRLSIDVSNKNSTRQVGAGDNGEIKVETVNVIVKIRKSGGGEYTDPLNLEVYVIGKQIQTGYYGIIDVVKEPFTFSKDLDNEFTFKTREYRLPRTSGNIGVGATYETYLVVVTDKDGKIIDTRCGRAIRQKGIDFVRELGPMTLFDRDGNILGKADESKAAFRAAAPAALQSGNY